jgi:hypothetical protein
LLIHSGPRGRRAQLALGHSTSTIGLKVRPPRCPVPDLIVPDLRSHLDALGATAALVFTSPAGAPLRHSNGCLYRRDQSVGTGA